MPLLPHVHCTHHDSLNLKAADREVPQLPWPCVAIRTEAQLPPAPQLPDKEKIFKALRKEKKGMLL